MDVYCNPLDTDELGLLTRDEAAHAVADPLDWWRDESDPGSASDCDPP